jgi:hypothetical protein
MNWMKLRSAIVLVVLILLALACNFSASTANIDSAVMARDPAGSDQTDVFDPSDTFYCVVDLQSAPDDTTVRAVWTAVNAEGVDANTLIDETTLTTGSSNLQFELSNTDLWPAGQYKVDLYLNDELDRTVEFSVQ